MKGLGPWLGAAALLLAACGPSTGTTTTATPASSTTPTTATTMVTTTTTTTTSSTTTTTASTTTSTTTTTVADPPPGRVQGVVVSTGAGSGEIDISWQRNPEPDVDHYEVWYSQDPGAGKTVVDTVPHDPSQLGGLSQDLGGGRTLYTDITGRTWDEGKSCYQVRAVDTAGHAGPFSAETCLPVTPPSVVTGISVGMGGGSGEIAVIWRRNTDGDIDHYNIWYSLLPGQDKELLTTVPHDPSALGGNSQDMGDGRTMYIDFPRDLIEATNCYQVSAVDTAGNEGPRSVEACFDA